MKNPFTRTGFDTLIAKGTSIHGDLVLPQGSTTIIDGVVLGRRISTAPEKAGPTSLIIGGEVTMTDDVTVTDVTITGHLTCDALHVEGTLAIKLGAKVKADVVRYRRLIIEPGAVLAARLVHLDESTSETPSEA